jgi:RimJ/RimL family protein N-acetyltransferase
LIPLPEGRIEELREFLRADLPGAVFPLVNLTPAGLPMRCWIAPEAGRIAAFLGLAEGGMAMPVAPADWPGWAAARPALAGTRVSGLIGRPASVGPVRAALRLSDAATRRDAVEQGFALALDDLAMPAVSGLRLVALDARWRGQAEAWRAAYEVEVLGARADQASVSAAGTVARWIAQRSHRMLLEGETAVAMTGFNADLGEVVQVGGVWTPPEGRGRGLARAAVALHLAESRARGAAQAVLFAVSDAAARAYAAIGFRPAGRMALVLFDGRPQVAP